MGKLKDPLTGKWWFDLTSELTADEAKLERLRHAIAFDTPATEYISHGSGWTVASGTAPTMKTVTTTIGDNTTLSIVDARGNAFVDEDTFASGQSLTFTAAADTGYTLSTFTVASVDKKSTNPYTAAITDDTAVVTAATANTYAYTATTNELGTIVMLDDEEGTVSAGSTAVTHFEEYSITITPTDAETSVVTLTNGGAAVALTDTEGVYTATFTCVGAVVATIAAVEE